MSLRASRSFSSESAINLTAYVTNTSGHPAPQIAVTLNSPTGWVLNQNPIVTIPILGAKQSTSVTWSIQAPADVLPGAYPLADTAAYQSTTGQSSSAGTTTLDVPYLSLASLFDNVAVTSNSNPNPATGFLGFDGIGTTYSAEGLAADGITPGSKIASFTWPNVGPALP